MILNPFTLPQSSAGGLTLNITEYSAGYHDSFTLDSNCVAFILSRTFTSDQSAYVISSSFITMDEVNNVVGTYTSFKINGVAYDNADIVYFGKINDSNTREIYFGFDNNDITIKQFLQ